MLKRVLGWWQDSWAFLVRSDTALAFLIVLTVYILYWYTVAPTVLWGDDGHLQLNAVQGILQGSAGSHPIWVAIAHLFTRLLDGDIARRVNLVSSVFGALTIGFLFALLRELGLRRGASVLAVLAFAISHTFWQHAVRAEVYTMTLAFMVCFAWLGVKWFDTGISWYLIGGAFVFGLGLGVHLLIGLYAPGLIWLMVKRRPQWHEVLGAAVALSVGATPLILLLIRDTQTLGLQGVEILRWALFSFESYDFSSAMFDFRWRFLASDTFEWLFFLGFQFVSPAFICGLLGILQIWRRRSVEIAVYILLLYVVSLAFSFAYRVGDRYVFYLPSYVPFVVWIGIGIEWIRERFRSVKHRRVLYGLMVLMFVLTPISVYRLAPALVERGFSFRDTRHVPGPEGRYFFLWPAKTGYTDPRNYAEAVLRQAPAGAVLLADPILASPVRFLQVVEGVRDDVEVYYCCWDIEHILAAREGRPFLLADTAPEIYPLAWLQERFIIEQRKPIYFLNKK